MVASATLALASPAVCPSTQTRTSSGFLARLDVHRHRRLAAPLPLARCRHLAWPALHLGRGRPPVPGARCCRMMWAAPLMTTDLRGRSRSQSTPALWQGMLTSPQSQRAATAVWRGLPFPRQSLSVTTSGVSDGWVGVALVVPARPPCSSRHQQQPRVRGAPRLRAAWLQRTGLPLTPR